MSLGEEACIACDEKPQGRIGTVARQSSLSDNSADREPVYTMLKNNQRRCVEPDFSGPQYFCGQEKFTSEDLRIIRGRAHKRTSATPRANR
jgi:hypothetical protein